MRTRILQHILAALAVLTVIAAQAADRLKDTYQILSGGVLRQFDVATDELQRTRPTGEQWTMQIPAQPNAEAVRQHAEQLQATLGDQVELVLYEKGSPRNEFTRRVSTKKVFVRLARGTNAQALAQSLGAVSLGELSYAPGCFIFQVNQPGAMLTLAERLQQQPGVEFVEPLLAARTILHYTPNDTYFGNQWHLRNTGQNGGTPGVDVAVSSVWDLYDGTGTKMHGNGITIGILDTGVQIAHPDLAPNVDLALSWDYVDGNNDPSPNPTWSGAGHGTCVAGLSAARGDNNLGVCGVAYESRLAGLRLPIGVYTDPDSVAAAFARGNNLIQVKNNSWGYIPFYAASAPETNALANGVLTGRGGLGTIYVFAAGNGAQNGWDANSHTLANSRFVIQVGAVNDRGDKTFYSEPGASLLVAAPGSDYYIAPIGITTTDMLGNNGYNYSGTLGDLSDVDYTQLFNGTSAAAPIVSGVIALMLQANPSLTWRDVQEILIRSATMNSPSDPDWVAHSAGFRFHPKFGAGLVNAERAVSLAQSWANLGPETNVFIAQSGLTLPIPDNNVAGVGIAFDFDTSYPTLRVEHVEVTVNITHPRRGDLVITLTSPGGMQSRLAELRTDNAANYNWTFMTTRHWGESSRGIWSLQVADRAAGQTGTVTACTVRIYGTGAGASTSPSLPAWGDNSVGQLATPTGVTNVVAISAGTTHSLALNADGKVVAWGN
ncbi:MAG: S8 family serine peptidase, partial [Verrucomicrobiae bacterium]|nr:S8 family serine peptidase [Verrucomicrobiae bacterium]